MDEVHEFCLRVLGPGADAEAAASEALARRPGGRVELLAAAARACRARATHDAPPAANGDVPGDLAGAVEAEVRIAVAKLPERQREALALRELLRLSHAQIADVMGIDAAAVAPLLARGRLRLREERRGTSPAPVNCPDRDRALRALACRQDSEPMSGEDDEWLFAHLRECDECDRAHAAMIEASFCYRAASPHGSRNGAGVAGGE